MFQWLLKLRPGGKKVLKGLLHMDCAEVTKLLEGVDAVPLITGSSSRSRAAERGAGPLSWGCEGDHIPVLRRDTANHVMRFLHLQQGLENGPSPRCDSFVDINFILCIFVLLILQTAGIDQRLLDVSTDKFYVEVWWVGNTLTVGSLGLKAVTNADVFWVEGVSQLILY